MAVETVGDKIFKLINCRLENGSLKKNHGTISLWGWLNNNSPELNADKMKMMYIGNKYCKTNYKIENIGIDGEIIEKVKQF